MKAKILFLATRPGFFTASIVCVLLGLAAGWLRSGRSDWLAAIAVLAGSVLIHAGADMMNDYDDHVSGADEANHNYISPFSGGSRMIQMGILTPGEVRRAAWALVAAGAVLFALLALRSGPLMLLLAAFAAASALTYTGRPISLASRGLGELVVGINFGPVLVSAGYYVQARAFPFPAILITLPMMLLVMAILWVNEMPDYEGDRAAGKRTLVVRLGLARASDGYAVLVGLSYLSIAAGVLARQLPLQALIALATLPLGILAALTVRRFYDQPAQMSPASVQTIVNHLLTGLLLVAALVSAGSSIPLLPLGIGSAIALVIGVRTYKAMDGMRKAFLAQRGLVGEA